MKQFERVIHAIRQVLGQYPSPDLEQRGAFVANLVFLFHMIRATEHLLEVAVENSTGSLHDYFTEHLEEERQHEKWLADDLKTAGIDVHDTPVPRLAVELIGTQYYFLHHIDPAALLGYMAMQECFPKPMDVVERLEALHGKELCRTLRYHATHDVQHGADLLHVIDELPERSQLLVLQNAIQSARYFAAATQTFKG